MTKAQVLAQLKKRIAAYPSRQAAASAMNCSYSYLADVLAGRRDPGVPILKALGLTRRRAITYTEAK